jgi:hypothetical protein
MAASIHPLDPSAIPELSALLRQQFCPAGEYCDFADERVLTWKFFERRPHWTVSRSWGGFEDGKLVAHVGYNPTTFSEPGKSNLGVDAGHISDWVSLRPGSALGALLMLETLKLAPVHYALGSTAIASRVLLKGGYKHLLDVPLFHRVVNRFNIPTWEQLHGKHRSAKGLALLALDGLNSLRLRGRARGLEALPVKSFGTETADIFSRSTCPVICSSRSPELLNYYLNYPLGTFSGYLLRDSRPRGFAILALIQKPGCRLVRIVECFLDEPAPGLCAQAISVLCQRALEKKPDIISVYGSTPWMAEGLQKAGFFRRGKTPLFVRDPKKLLPEGRPFHLSHLEADLSFI